MKRLAVIILNWNGLELLQQFLPAAAKYSVTPCSDLYVADNGSTDSSVEWVKGNFPEVKVLELGRNLGFAEGYNRAIGMTGHEFTLLLNSDVEVTEGWLSPLVECMDSHPRCAALQPKIRWWRERDMFEYAGAAGGLLDRHGYPYCRGRLLDSLEKDEGQYDGHPVRVAWASGAALLVRTRVYEDVGGLDREFFAHMEEIDLCCRMQAAGYEVMCVPSSTVFHVGGATLAQGNPKKTYLNFRNNLLLLHKNSPLGRGRRRLLVRRLYDTLAWGMYMLKGDWKNASAVLRAHRDFRRMKKGYTSLPQKEFLSTLPGYGRNIIIDRYIKRKKK